MSQKSKQYFRNRANDILVESEKKGIIATAEYLSVLQNSRKELEKEYNSVLKNYTKEGVLDVKELEKRLTGTRKKEIRKKLVKEANNLGLDGNFIFDDRYINRLSALQALKDEVDLLTNQVSENARKTVQKDLTSIFTGAYKNSTRVLKNGGFKTKTREPDTKQTDLILRSKIEGKNFSQRIWKNTDKLAGDIKATLASKNITGKSPQKIINDMRKRYDVGASQARTLVVTETNFFHNQANLQSFLDNNIEEYIYDAEMDKRTTKVCRDLNNKRFKTVDAVAGVNYPSMHPFCRSKPVAVTQSNRDIKNNPADRLNFINSFDESRQEGLKAIQRNFLNRSPQVEEFVENLKNFTDLDMRQLSDFEKAVIKSKNIILDSTDAVGFADTQNNKIFLEQNASKVSLYEKLVQFFETEDMEEEPDILLLFESLIDENVEADPVVQAYILYRMFPRELKKNFSKSFSFFEQLTSFNF